jgi:hypothetical protein
VCAAREFISATNVFPKLYLIVLLLPSLCSQRRCSCFVIYVWENHEYEITIYYTSTLYLISPVFTRLITRFYITDVSFLLVFLSICTNFAFCTSKGRL